MTMIKKRSFLIVPFALACALALLVGCEVTEDGSGTIEEDSSRGDAAADAITRADGVAIVDAANDGAEPRCTEDSECPSPPGLSMCEGQIAVQNAPRGVCDQGFCTVGGEEATRTDCEALGRVCQEGMCVEGHFGCPPEANVIGAACDASQEGVVCEYGTECCCGECHPSLVCTCGGGQFGCFATDACLIQGCPGECRIDLDCPSDQFCDYTDGICGAQGFSDGKGQCMPKPTTCDAGGTGVCACNGSTPTNDCEANASGQDISRFGGCDLEAGGFDCGGILSCELNTYCAISMNDTPGPEYFASCAPIPAECDTPIPTCACMPAETFATCNDSTGHIVVVYPGG